MCNIAGYVGEKRAAPILLEMLRNQQGFDGGACTGIATIHEGRIYYRKIVGDVDTLIKTTDAFYLPGNIGIAHSRPGGTAETWGCAHPFITYGEDMACVTNGTGRGINVKESVAKVREMLDSLGYKFRGECFSYDEPRPSALKNGAIISGAEVRLNAIYHYHKAEGMSLTAAMARADGEMYKDGVIEIMDLNAPDRLYVLRTSRPAITLKASHGTYIATTRFAFPEDEVGELVQLPVMHPCEIFKDKIVVSSDKIQGEEVSEITDYTLSEGYKRIEAMLRGKKDAPLYFDDMELAVWREMRDLFPGDHTLIQDARLVYDVLWRLHEEGRLHTRTLLMGRTNRYEPSDPMYNDARNQPGFKNRTFMWLED